MKAIMVVGLGSMGKRRLRLLKQLRPGLRICGVDIDERRREDVNSTYEIPVYSQIAQAVVAEHPEAAVISAAPLSHAALIRQCLKAGLHVFTELNLVPDSYRENMKLAEQAGLVLFLSSTFLYRKENRYIIKKAQESGILNYRYHVGQYLPDWHPWESYEGYFVGDKRTNGCRELFAIELPWLCAAFGPISETQVIHRRCSGLNISYDDSYMLLLRHRNGHMGSLCIDVISRKAVRLFEMYNENTYLTWGGEPHTLYEWASAAKELQPVGLYDAVEHQDGYAAFTIENAYQEELAAFMKQIEQGEQPSYGFADDLVTLQLIEEIEGDL